MSPIIQPLTELHDSFGQTHVSPSLTRPDIKHLPLARHIRNREQYLLHPYPVDKPPLSVLYTIDEDWLNASQEVLIFTHQVPESDDEKMRLLEKKSEHFQFYFWTALDRGRRFNKPLDGSGNPWKPFDIRTMLTWWRMCHQAPLPGRVGISNDGLWRDLLLSSPWFDCPLFHDLLCEVATDDNGQPRTETVDGEDLVTLKPRDPRSGALESKFDRRWCLVAMKVPLRRFENGDAVLPITAKYYEARYGTESMQWDIRLYGSSLLLPRFSQGGLEGPTLASQEYVSLAAVVVGLSGSTWSSRSGE